MASKKNNTTEPTEATIKVEKQLLKTIWVKEAELIQEYVPEEDLTKNQQKLLQKCIDKEDFTDKQFTIKQIPFNLTKNQPWTNNRKCRQNNRPNQNRTRLHRPNGIRHQQIFTSQHAI